MLELYQLEELVAFADHGTISKASEAVGVSQPAMSRSMRLLEEEFGVPIFNRTSNSIELNDTGKKAVEYARAIVESVEKAKESVRSYDRSLKTILVGSEAPAPLWTVLSMLSSTYYDKTIAGEMKDRSGLVSGLRNGTYRFIITTDAVRLPGFSTVFLGEERLSFILPSDHPLASRSTLSFKDLDGENMLLLEHIGFWRDLPEKMMPHSKFFIQDDNTAFNELVRKSSLPSFASNLAGENLEGKVKIPISDKEATVEFYVTGRNADHGILTTMVRRFSANRIDQS